MMNAFASHWRQCPTSHVEGDFASDDRTGEEYRANDESSMTRDINAKFSDAKDTRDVFRLPSRRRASEDGSRRGGSCPTECAGTLLNETMLVSAVLFACLLAAGFYRDAASQSNLVREFAPGVFVRLAEPDKKIIANSGWVVFHDYVLVIDAIIRGARVKF